MAPIVFLLKSAVLAPSAINRQQIKAHFTQLPCTRELLSIFKLIQPGRQLSIPAHRLEHPRSACHGSGLRIWSQVSEEVGGRQEQEMRDPPISSLCFSPRKAKPSEAEKQVNRHLAAEILSQVDELLSQLPPRQSQDHTSFTYSPKSRPPAPRAGSDRGAPWAPAPPPAQGSPTPSASLQWHRAPWKGFSFPKGRVQLGSTLPSRGPVGRGAKTQPIRSL